MESTLYSIGHGNKTIAEFEQELASFDIAYLVDIRTKPYSKWNPDFNQNSLQTFLTQVNIKYVYMGNELGGMPQDTSCYTDGHIDYAKMSEKDFFIQGLKRLIVANQKSIKLAIMCSESDPTMCHRTKLIGQELLKHNIVINHIVGVHKKKIQYEVINALTKGNGVQNLFGEEITFISRKSYI